jgi:hypothetical protein
VTLNPATQRNEFAAMKNNKKPTICTGTTLLPAASTRKTKTQCQRSIRYATKGKEKGEKPTILEPSGSMNNNKIQGLLRAPRLQRFTSMPRFVKVPANYAKVFKMILEFN